MVANFSSKSGTRIGHGQASSQEPKRANISIIENSQTASECNQNTVHTS